MMLRMVITGCLCLATVVGLAAWEYVPRWGSHLSIRVATPDGEIVDHISFTYMHCGVGDPFASCRKSSRTNSLHLDDAISWAAGVVTSGVVLFDVAFTNSKEKRGLCQNGTLVAPVEVWYHGVPQPANVVGTFVHDGTCYGRIQISDLN